MKTRDIDVRTQLHNILSREFPNDDETFIVDEFVVCQGKARVDVAIINGSIHGYEIKSDSDTLDRLPKQMEVYNKVFDTVSIVTGKEHYEKIKNMVPEWWGIYLALQDDTDSIHIKKIRTPENNVCLDAFALGQFLLRDEVLKLLSKHGLDKGVRRYPKFWLLKLLTANIELSEIRVFVRMCLKERQSRKLGLQHM